MEDKYDFSNLTDVDLCIMQSNCKTYREDKKFREELLKELGRREKSRMEAYEDSIKEDLRSV